ncbi:hypothetical protein Anas_10398 [Armadillidium nasatum]|uniref:Uncharacterized protein n=1 Tax=Armadillidium nasatum TaxID=96803 RepID=A0A5N5SI81_9CRUS|nr:hypothetical protein Anas_10398 [Armadillidium nasatum]
MIENFLNSVKYPRRRNLINQNRRKLSYKICIHIITMTNLIPPVMRISMQRKSLNSTGCILYITIVVIIPKAMIIIGSLNVGECPAEPFIPINLVVFGSIQILTNFLSILNRLDYTVTGKVLRCTFTEEKAQLPWYRRVHIPLLVAFLFVWGFAGGFYIGRLGEANSTDRSSSRYCSYSLQMFVFWVIKPVSATMFCLCFLYVIVLTCKAIWQKCHLALTKVISYRLFSVYLFAQGIQSRVLNQGFGYLHPRVHSVLEFSDRLEGKIENGPALNPLEILDAILQYKRIENDK